MFLSAVSVLVVAQSSSEILEGLMNNPVYIHKMLFYIHKLAKNISNVVDTYYCALYFASLTIFSRISPQCKGSVISG